MTHARWVVAGLAVAAFLVMLPVPVRAIEPAQPLASGHATAPQAGDLRQAVRAALERTALRNPHIDEAAIRELLDLYSRLDRDTQLARSERERLRISVRGRLLRLATRIERRLDHQQRQFLRSTADRSLADGGGTAPPVATEEPGARGGGAQSDDLGDELVDLIRNTVAPASWDVNGGPGTIHYWRPQHALVVRQTGEVHERIGGVVRGLRQ